MGVVGITIREPVHGTALLARAGGSRSPVRFRCDLDAEHAGDTTLQVRWWSSLPVDPGPVPDPRPDPASPPDLGKVAFGTGRDLSRPLWIGSQAITVSAKDVATDDPASLNSVTSAGMAGGAPGTAPQPCLLHVLAAEPVLSPPASPGAKVELKRAGGVWAEAPALWNEPGYVAVNGLIYRWSFSPPTGPVVFLEPPRSGLSFLTRDNSLPPRVGVKPIPSTVTAGDYQLTLHVGFRATPGQGAFDLVADATMSVAVKD